MEESYSVSDLTKINEEISKYPKDRYEWIAGRKYSYKDMNLNFVVDFINGIKSDKYIFSQTEYMDWQKRNLESLTYEENEQFKVDCSHIIETGGQVVNINCERLEIISKHKRLDMYLRNGEYVGNDNIVVTQLTPEGYYYFKLRGYGNPNGGIDYYYDLNFVPAENGYDESLMDVSLAEKKWVVPLDKNSTIVSHMPLSITETDLPKLANMIYRNGLPSLREKLMNGGKLELTEEDKKNYQLTIEEEEKLQNIQNPQVIEVKKENNVESPGLTDENEKIAQHLIALRDSGIELTTKQKSIIEFYEKFNSDKFKRFKENREERTKRQKEIREQVKAESERIHQWNNSPEHPANIRKEKRIEQLKQLRTQLNAMENLRSVAPDLLTQQQLEMLQTGYVFLDMIDKSNSEVHELDTGMSEEMREWYKEQYGGKSR